MFLLVDGVSINTGAEKGGAKVVRRQGKYRLLRHQVPFSCSGFHLLFLRDPLPAFELPTAPSAAVRWRPSVCPCVCLPLAGVSPCSLRLLPLQWPAITTLSRTSVLLCSPVALCLCAAQHDCASGQGRGRQGWRQEKGVNAADTANLTSLFAALRCPPAVPCFEATNATPFPNPGPRPSHPVLAACCGWHHESQLICCLKPCNSSQPHRPLRPMLAFASSSRNRAPALQPPSAQLEPEPAPAPRCAKPHKHISPTPQRSSGSRRRTAGKASRSREKSNSGSHLLHSEQQLLGVLADAVLLHRLLVHLPGNTTEK